MSASGVPQPCITRSNPASPPLRRSAVSSELPEASGGGAPDVIEIDRCAIHHWEVRLFDTGDALLFGFLITNLE